MAERIPQSATIRVPLQAFLSSDHVTPATGKTIAITISKNGAAYGNPSAGATNATEIASGSYYVDLSTTDTGTLGPLFVLGTVSGVDNVVAIYNVVNAHNAGYDGVPNATAGASTGLWILGANAAATTTLTGAAASGATPATAALALTGGAASTTGGGTAAPALTATGGAGAGSTNGAAAGVTFAGGGTNTVASNAHGFQVTGTSTGHGLLGTSGGGATGDGIAGVAASTNGNGISGAGAGTADGLRATGGLTGRGIHGLGGATSGAGIRGEGVGGNSLGIHGVGIGSGPGFQADGGATGQGALFNGGATSGVAIQLSTTSGDGLSITPTAGNAITATANGTSKHGIQVTGGTAGTSDGLKLIAGTGGVGFRLDTMTASGAVTLSSTLTVSGTTSLAAVSASGTVTFNAFTVTNATTLSGAVSLGSTLTVTGATSLAAVTTSGTVTFNALTVTNATTLSGAVSLGSTLSVTGTTTLAALSATGTVTFGALTVSGATTLTGAVTATNAGNDIRGVALTTTGVAAIATGVWQDATAGDFTVASSIGKSLYTTGALPGAAGGLVIAGSNAATTFATLTSTGAFSISGVSNIAQTGDSFARIGLTGSGLTSLAPSATALSTATWTNARAGYLDNLNVGGLVASHADTNAIPGLVWDVPLAAHLNAGSTGFALNAAGSAGDPWATLIPGAYGAGTAGFLVGNQLGAVVTGVTMHEALRRIGAVTGGVIVDAGTATEHFADYLGAACAAIQVDATGNRTVVTWS